MLALIYRANLLRCIQRRDYLRYFEVLDVPTSDLEIFLWGLKMPIWGLMCYFGDKYCPAKNGRKKSTLKVRARWLKAKPVWHANSRLMQWCFRKKGRILCICMCSGKEWVRWRPTKSFYAIRVLYKEDSKCYKSWYVHDGCRHRWHWSLIWRQRNIKLFETENRDEGDCVYSLLSCCFLWSFFALHPPHKLSHFYMQNASHSCTVPIPSKSIELPTSLLHT